MEKKDSTRNTVFKFTRDVLLICFGITSAAFGLESFLLPNKFLDGGVTGISLLANIVTGINFPLLLIGLNLPFVIMGYFQISLNFALKTLGSIIILALVINLIHFPALTHDKLLVSIFGGFFLGVGTGLCVRGGCVLDGTEVFALYVSRRSSMSVGDVISLLNVVIFFTAAWLVNLETALYSIVTYFSASKAVDFLIHGIEEYIGVTIISESHEEIRITIIEKLRRGVTIYKGESGFEPTKSIEKKILYTVVTRIETTRLLAEIEKIDPKAFVIQQPVNDTKGGIIRKKPIDEMV